MWVGRGDGIGSRERREVEAGAGREQFENRQRWRERMRKAARRWDEENGDERERTIETRMETREDGNERPWYGVVREDGHDGATMTRENRQWRRWRTRALCANRRLVLASSVADAKQRASRAVFLVPGPSLERARVGGGGCPPIKQKIVREKEKKRKKQKNRKGRRSPALCVAWQALVPFLSSFFPSSPILH